MSSGLLTLGETMAVATAPSGRLRNAGPLTLSIAGAETNVAIGVRRLGVEAAWIGRVGADELGALVLSRVRGEGVDVTGAVTDPEAQTGLMLKDHRTSDVMRVSYYRHNSAGSRLCVDDIDPGRIRSADVLHVTGITPALSESARDAVFTAVEIARDANIPVSVDVNHRDALWSADIARPVLRALVADADIVFAGVDEAILLGLRGSGTALLEGLHGLGPGQALLKLGARGALAMVDGRRYEAPAVEARVIDAVGAGDAFAAGYLAELLAGAPAGERLRTAASCGAFAVATLGDWEGLPTREDLDLLSEPGAVLR